jgi:hypothetical protein
VEGIEKGVPGHPERLLFFTRRLQIGLPTSASRAADSGDLLGCFKGATLPAEQSFRKHGELVVMELARFVELDLGFHCFAAFALTLLRDVPLVMCHSMSSFSSSC